VVEVARTASRAGWQVPHRGIGSEQLRVAGDLGDATLMAKAWERPEMSDMQPAISTPPRFGQLQNLSVPDAFDDPLTDAEVAAWEGDSRL
jgi:hypothetical protein